MGLPDSATTLAWTRLLRAHDRALLTVAGALKSAKLPTLAWYDVLLELDRAGADGLRPFELQDKLLLPQYGISRLLDRIEKAGYLRRMSCDDDGRGQVLFITGTGRQMRTRMWKVYGPAIEAAVGQRLSAGEAKMLSGLLAKLT